MQRLAEKRPEEPKGLLATFKEKSHQQAVVAWEHAKEVASELARQARQLAQRLREAADPQRVRQWAQELVRQRWPQEQERVKVQGQEQAPQAELAAKEAPRREPEPKQRPVSEHLLASRRDWQRVMPLLDKAKTRSLDLEEKRDVARGWDGLFRLVEAGHREATTVQRQAIDQARLQAHRQVAAAEFLALPADEIVHAYPKLEAAYFMLDAVEQRSKAAGHSQAQRELVHQRSRQKIAAAIEHGQEVRLKDLIDFEQPVQARERERPAPEQDRGRER